MKLLLMDNFDSFVYNLFQSLSKLGHEVEVFRNNEITVEEIRSKAFDKIIISPGPGNPVNEKDFGVCSEIISKLSPSTPILGVCLGHQGIVSSFGGKIIQLKEPMHGKTSNVTHNEEGIFSGLNNPLTVVRYHSLVSDEKAFPKCLKVTAKSDDNKIMAIQHKKFPVFGVQFHPESISSEQGEKLLENFCNIEEIL